MGNEEQMIIELLRNLEQEMALYKSLILELPCNISKNSPSYADTMERKRDLEMKLVEVRHNWWQLDMRKTFPSDGQGVADLLDSLFHQTYISVFQYSIWKASKRKIGDYTAQDIKEAEAVLDWVKDDDDEIHEVKYPNSPKMEGPYTFNIVCYFKGILPKEHRQAVLLLGLLPLKVIQQKYAAFKNEILAEKTFSEAEEQDPYLPGPSNDDLDNI
ncbi:hypothetical protein KAR91_39340, partial [Candidatus Pacearchaeota archaeon]|nr:hypothetical protein [Candidatus Pacearchaeota archaeon]